MKDTTGSVEGLVAAARAGGPRELARLISMVENDEAAARMVLSALGASGRARVIGITGPPGAGKSTLSSALVSALRGRGQRVAVVAVDPTSPFTSGALLGDRIRMAEHAMDPGVFIRSMASRGHLGGLSATAPLVVRVLDAVGFDAVLVETVGVGQSEIEIAGAADTTVVIVAPGMGDAVQAAKAGVLEIGDVLVVNKADRDGAVATARELKSMVALGDAAGWRPPVVASVATTGEGVDEVLAAIDRHWEWIASSGELAARRSRRAREEIEAIASARIRKRMEHSGVLDHLSEQVSTGALDPFTAAERLVAALG